MLHAEAAEHFAYRSRSAELAGWVSCTKTMIDLWRNRPSDALNHAPPSIGSRSGSHRLNGLHARALAIMGRREEAAAGLKELEARTCFVENDELSDLGAMFTFPEGRQRYYSTVTHSLLGNYEIAEGLALSLGYGASPPLGTSTWPISWVLSRAHIALASLQFERKGHVPLDAAMSHLAPILEISEGQRISQLAQVLRSITKALSIYRFRDAADAIQLRSRLQVFLAANNGAEGGL